MPASNPLNQRLSEIEARLRAIEGAMGLEAPATRKAPPPVAPPVATPISTPPVAGARDSVQAPGHVAPVKKPRPAWSWEQLIGGKLFAALGALVVVTGLALFLKLAYDLGWLGQISGAGKCLIGAVFGAALLGAGELARRRWNAFASAGLSAAGIGAMYASAFSAYSLYELLTPTQAFGALSLISLLGVGVGVALRARLASVAVLSILSAYLTPVLLARADSPVHILPIYLLSLTGLGLVLSAIHPRFRVLRSLVWWGTALLGGMWVLMRAGEAPTLAVVFCALVWFAFHAELLWSARHGGMGGDRPKRHAYDAARPLVVSLATTSWSVLLAAFAINEAGSPELWLVPGGAMVVTVISSMVLSGHLRVLRDTPRTDEERLGAVLLAQSGALLIATVAMGVTTDWLQVACWLVFGVFSIFAGRWIGSRALNVYGLIVLVLGLGRLVLLDSWVGTMRAGGQEVWGLVLTEWTLMMVIAGACWIVAGRLLVRRASTRHDSPQPLAAVCAVVGVVVLLGSFAHELAEPGSLAIVLGGIALIASAAHRLDRRLAIDIGALVALLGASVAWSVAYPLAGWDRYAGGASIHPGLWAALALAAMFVGAALTPRGRASFKGYPLGPIVLAVLLVFTSSSLELARHVVVWTDDPAARAGAVSIWWGVFAIALLSWGFLARSAGVRWAGLGLLGIATGKALIYDLSGVDPAWRVASFLALGLLLLGVGAGYMRRIGRAREDSPESDEADDPDEPT